MKGPAVGASPPNPHAPAPSGAPQNNAGSDALRCAMNIMMDHNFFDADPWQVTYASRYGAFIKSQGANYGDAYTRSGSPAGGSHSTAIVACDGLLAFGLGPADGAPFLQELWSRPIPRGPVPLLRRHAVHARMAPGERAVPALVLIRVSRPRSPPTSERRPELAGPA
ncbi:MAG: hypothetical protein JOZ69_25865 [Myxococcales bacterium]|nr:hypothetical protein [Myxococcales bacterium]